MFKTIPIYPNYEVDENSNIRGKRFGKIIKPKLTGGHYSVGLFSNGRYWWHNAHRLCAMAWIGLPEDYESMDVAHNDGDRTNNHYTNLRWATRTENSHDRYIHGTARGARAGEQHHYAVLTTDIVKTLRARVASGEKFSNVYRDMNIKKLTAYDALTGKTWAKVNNEQAPVKIKDVKNATA